MNYGKLDKKFYKVAFENLDFDLVSISIYLNSIILNLLILDIISNQKNLEV